jgi:hypothetical protein
MFYKNLTKFIKLAYFVFLMKYNRSKIISSIVIVTMLNAIQIKYASAQNLSRSNPTIPSQGANMLPNNSSAISNPSSIAGSNPTIPSQGANMLPNNSSAISNPSSTMTISPNFIGSISIYSPIVNAFKSSINYTLYDAIPIAENFLGNGSLTIEALTHPERGYIVYDIVALDPNNNAYKIIVDPGNGKILSSQQISIIEVMNMSHNTEGIGKGIKNYDMMKGSSYGMNNARP